jgi:hypothetical protein
MFNPNNLLSKVIIQDNNEIIDASWISIPGMMNLHTNVDVSKFLMVYKSIV